MTSRLTFAQAFEVVRRSLRLTQKRVGELHGVSSRTVERWALGASLPGLHDRIKLLQTFRAAPRAELEALARASGTTLEAAGLPSALPPAPAPTVATPEASGPTLQRAFETAVRELADELDLAASSVRPPLSRFLAELARVGVSTDMASRLIVQTIARVPGGKRARAR